MYIYIYILYICISIYLYIYIYIHTHSTKTKSMAMCGNYTQRVKIVINGNIIEQVTNFKYLDTVYQNTKVI